MEKIETKGRTIKFFSVKNQKTIIVHSLEAKIYADYLEKIDEVTHYEVLKEWDISLLNKLNQASIRKNYLQTKWVSDFLIYYSDHTTAIREIVKKNLLFNLSTIEKLELSRRYWKILKIENWKIIVKEK